MWKELIKKYLNKCNFNTPANPDQIMKAEKELDISLPEELKKCLMESNGISGEYELGLIWPIERIISKNLEFRNNKEFKELYMSFDSLLFFADAGNGDQFAYPIQSGNINRNDVFIWNHEDDSRTWVAPDLERYLEWWLSGKLEI